MALRAAHRFLPISTDFHGGRLVAHVDGGRVVTPLFLVFVAIGSIDLLFALDSIPAQPGVTRRLAGRPEGGLGDAVLEVLAEQPTLVRKLAVRGMPASATPDEQLRAAGLDNELDCQGRRGAGRSMSRMAVITGASAGRPRYRPPVRAPQLPGGAARPGRRASPPPRR